MNIGKLFEINADAPQPTAPASPDPSNANLELVGIQSAEQIAKIIPGATVKDAPHDPAAPPAALFDPAPAAEKTANTRTTAATSPVQDVDPVDEPMDERLERAIQAVADGAPCLIAVTYLDGDVWRHVVTTRDYGPHLHAMALANYHAQLRERE